MEQKNDQEIQARDEVGKIEINLPRKELIDNHAFYKRSLENYRKLYAELKKEIEKPNFKSKIGFHINFLFGLISIVFGRNKNVELEKAVLRCQLDETESRIEMSQYHLEIYQERIDDYEPIYIKETNTTNKYFDRIFEKALEFAKYYKVHPISGLVNDYPKMEQSQELKNELYRSLKMQEGIIDQKLDEARKRIAKREEKEKLEKEESA